MEDIMASPGLDNLHIIEAGPVPGNPSELLSAPSMGQFLREVREEYDIVLIDTPPVLPVTDSAIVAAQVDGVVLVYQAGKVGRLVLKRAKAHLDSARAKVWGVVLNDVQSEVADYSYTHYYTHYYGEESPGEAAPPGRVGRLWDAVSSRLGISRGAAVPVASSPVAEIIEETNGRPRRRRTSRYLVGGIALFLGLIAVAFGVMAWRFGAIDERPRDSLRRRLEQAPAAVPPTAPPRSSPLQPRDRESAVPDSAPPSESAVPSTAPTAPALPPVPVTPAPVAPPPSALAPPSLSPMPSLAPGPQAPSPAPQALSPAPPSQEPPSQSVAPAPPAPPPARQSLGTAPKRAPALRPNDTPGSTPSGAPNAAPSAPPSVTPKATPNAAPNATPNTTPNATPSAPVTRFAVEFGPFVTAPDAEKLERQLNQAGYQTVRFRQQMGGAEVFAVLIERLPSRREAELLAAALREQGFLDSVVLDGEPGPSVRVGEPLVLRGAVQLGERLRARGHQVRIAVQRGDAVTFVIRHGNFASQKEAETKSQELERLGLANNVVRVR
jgi:hypothetical protein